MAKKNKEDSITREEEAKNTGGWEDYYCMYSFKMKPVNPKYLEKFALEWIEAAEKDEKYINIWKFPAITKRMITTTVEDWMKRDINVKNAHTYVKRICAIRRDQGAAEKHLDGSWIAKTMPMYCDEYKALEEWRAGLSAKIDAPPTTVVVEMKPFELPKPATKSDIKAAANKSRMRAK